MLVVGLEAVETGGYEAATDPHYCHGFPAEIISYVDQRSFFRAAAARLGVTPSALSHSMRQLEERLAVRLRIGRRAAYQRPMLANACSASFGRQSRKSPVR